MIKTPAIRIKKCVASAMLIAVCNPLYAGPEGTTVLEQYVYTSDPAYAYNLTDTQNFQGYTVYTLLMDSLRWRSETEVDRTLWTHQVIVVVPDAVTTTTALLLINGGSDPLDPPDPLLTTLGATIAVGSGSVIAAVSQIPNQPLRFPDQTDAINEDTLVAYSWDKAIATGEADWAAYMPMTKASVRAMDAVQRFVNDAVTHATVDDFVVSGFSKRGATAWLVAAVDPRVRAAAPGVFDILNMPVQIERHWEAYGFYAPAISDYVDFDIVRRVRSPEGRWLARIIDPFSYTATLNIPKLVLNSTGDQFFLPDAALFYYDGLPGETLIRQIPNTDHGLTNGLFQALDAILAWYNTVLNNTPRPVIAWQTGAGVLEVSSSVVPVAARLWTATNTKTRDFRLELIGAVWNATELNTATPGVWQITLNAPDTGWSAYLVELEYPGVNGPPAQTYTTPVFIQPDDLPFVLDEPRRTPQVARYWRCQLRDAPSVDCPRPPDVATSELASFLHIPLFGDYVHDLTDLEVILSQSGTADARARAACMATRLNIGAGELGWYTGVRVDKTSTRLWQVYDRAESAYASGDPATAARLCRSLNQGALTPHLH